ncbi:tail fiber assembly protein [Klebsiella quasipneumoniae]|uniref:tail fiber assembly protein n=1 Tax=Klebsiella quasipneumoniae TaxID=1463165 RepID=UPI001F552A31|nr:tail fiber assembly protein [Klebsiella quasipneumoniae]
MSYYFSASRNAFYHDQLRSSYELSEDGWPADAIEISDTNYQELISGQSDGQIIMSGEDGKPCLTYPEVNYS